jgi:hypothetical protein
MERDGPHGSKETRSEQLHRCSENVPHLDMSYTKTALYSAFPDNTSKELPQRSPVFCLHTTLSGISIGLYNDETT